MTAEKFIITIADAKIFEEYIYSHASDGDWYKIESAFQRTLNRPYVDVLDELDRWISTYPNRPITPKIIHEKILELRKAGEQE